MRVVLLALLVLSSLMARADSWGWSAAVGASGHSADETSAANNAEGAYFATCGPGLSYSAIVTHSVVSECPAGASADSATSCKTQYITTCPGNTSLSGDTSTVVAWWQVPGAASSSDCSSVAGQIVDYTVAMSGTADGVCPPPHMVKSGEVQWDGNMCLGVSSGSAVLSCHAKSQRCEWPMGFTLADGSKSTLFSGVSKVDNTGCATADLSGTAKNARADSNTKGISGGGAGTGDTGADTAKIASNTAKTNEILQKLADQAGTGTGGGSCGGDGQPACKIDEGSTATSDSNTSANIGDQSVATANAIRANELALEEGGPAFAPGAGRWSLSVALFFPEAACEWTDSMDLGVIGSVPFHFSVCSWGGYVRDFLYWACGLMTFVSLWVVLFRRGS